MQISKLNQITNFGIEISAPTAAAPLMASVFHKNTAKTAQIQLDDYKINSVEKELPKIGFLRLAFSYLSDEQVAAINKAGRLPDNAIFQTNGFGGYTIHNNFSNITPGTQKLPEGFELKQNIFGFTIVVPKETKGLFIKK